MIDALILENFKAFGSRQVIPFAPITLVFGANSSGKSSILQALLLAKQIQTDQAYDGDVSLNGNLVNIGGYHDLVHNHQLERICEISIAFRPLTTNPNPFYRAFGRQNQGYFAFLDEERDELIRWGYGEPEPDPFEDSNPVAFGVRISWNAEQRRASLAELPLYVDDLNAPFAVWERFDGSVSDDVQDLEQGRRPLGGSIRFDMTSLDATHPKWEQLFRRYLATRLEPDLARLAPFVDAFSSDSPPQSEGRFREQQDEDLPASLRSKGPGMPMRLSMLDSVTDPRFLQQWYETTYQKFALAGSADSLDVQLSRLRNSVVHSSTKNILPFDEYLRELFASLTEFRLSEFIQSVVEESRFFSMWWRNFRISADSGVDHTELTPFFAGFPEVQRPEFLAADLEGSFVPRSHSLPNVALFAEQLVSNRLRGIVDAIRYVGPIRTLPDRVLVRSGRIHDTVGHAGEFASEMLLSHQNLVEETNQWLDKMEVGHRVEMAAAEQFDSELFSLRLVDPASGARLPPHAVGFGVGQVLPVVVESLWSRGNIVMIEQPELHLHPRLQTELGSLFADCVSSSRGNQFIVETHSEHLILRLQRLVRRGELRSDDVCVLYVNKDSDGSSVLHLRLDGEGDFIDEWPSGFFEEDFEERFGA